MFMPFVMTELEENGEDISNYTRRLLPPLMSVMKFIESNQIEGPHKLDKYLNDEFHLLRTTRIKDPVNPFQAMQHLIALKELLPENSAKKGILLFLIDQWFVIE